MMPAVAFSSQLERELTAVTEQRDEVRDEVREVLRSALEERDKEWFQIIESFAGYHPVSMTDALQQGIAHTKKLKRKRDEAREQLTKVTEQRDRLAEAIRITLMENLDLCDGDICTLKRLKDAIGFDLDHTETTP
jgi:uncharacterized coiled-coil DUF342 family protein